MTFDLFDKLLNSEMFCFFHNCLCQSWYSEVNVDLIHLYGSHRSCLIFFFIFLGIDTQLCVDSNPPTGLTVLDNWVFGFGWIRWVSLLLPATSESKSFSFCTTSESKTRLKSDRNCTSLSASASLKNMLRARELHVASAKVNTGHTWRQLMKSLQQSVR